MMSKTKLEKNKITGEYICPRCGFDLIYEPFNNVWVCGIHKYEIKDDDIE